LSFDRKKQTRQLTAWLVGACFAACSIYEVPEKRLGDDPGDETAGGAGKGGGGSSSVAGDGGTGAVSPSAGNGSTPNGGVPNAGAGGGGSGGSTMAGAGGDPTEGGDGGEGGAGPNGCPACAALRDALVHRYDFEGSGTAVMDRVGSAHGAVVGSATLSKVDGKGVLVLGGGTSGAYVNLPNELLSSLTNATLEAWVTWAGGSGWQRIFDFGDSTAASPEDNPANGKSYLFLTPTTTTTGGVMRTAYSLSGVGDDAETRADAAAALPLTLTQVAVVVDAAGGQLLLYQNGKVVGGQALSAALGSINDVNCWLGRSQYEADPELEGTFHDFRIYDVALTASQIAASFAGGPDPAFLAE
jgi:hypothetical protein